MCHRMSVCINEIVIVKMNIGLKIALLLSLIGTCNSKSIDRILTEAQSGTESTPWYDYKAPGMKDNRRLVKLQLDMILPIEDAKRTFPSLQIGSRHRSYRRQKRSAIRDRSKLWPRRIPYEIDNSFSWTQRQAIEDAINHWETYTCLDFVKRNNREHSYIVFVYSRTRCDSYVGNQQRRQTILLSPLCLVKGVIIHEIGHAVGLYHEHTRPDRDKYVTIIEKNIQNGAEWQFEKGNWYTMDNYSKPYDFLSIMHYSKDLFSKKAGLLTVKPVRKYRDFLNRIGTGTSLSFLDTKLIYSMYSCSDGCLQKECPGNGFLGKTCDCLCPSENPHEPVQLCHQSHCEGFNIDQSRYRLYDDYKFDEIRSVEMNFPNGTRIHVVRSDGKRCIERSRPYVCINGNWNGRLPICDDPTESFCYDMYHEGACYYPAPNIVTRKICCCSSGQAWGPACERCPKQGSDEYSILCPKESGVIHNKVASVDIDVCRMYPDSCLNGKCVKTYRSFICVCDHGFAWDPAVKACTGKKRDCPLCDSSIGKDTETAAA